ncbi:hypothetical protein DMB38_00540 [Streptomyces sp. WAC 06738]|nr:hypothetical protein DMB38_00540 [Streptomyces sp. WAC 06738]
MMSTVPFGSSGRGSAAAASVERVRRGVSSRPLRTASWGSPAVRASASCGMSAGLGLVTAVSVSMRWMRSGFSFWAVRTRPHSGACARWTSSAGPVATARWVRTTSCRSVSSLSASQLWRRISSASAAVWAAAGESSSTGAAAYRSICPRSA